MTNKYTDEMQVVLLLLFKFFIRSPTEHVKIYIRLFRTKRVLINFIGDMDKKNCV